MNTQWFYWIFEHEQTLLWMAVLRNALHTCLGFLWVVIPKIPQKLYFCDINHKMKCNGPDLSFHTELADI